MAGQEVAIRDTFSVGLFGGNKKDSGASGAGVIGVLSKIQGTLNVLVGLTQQSLSIQKGEQIIDQREQLASSLKGAEADPKKIPKGEGRGFIGQGWDKLKGAFGRAKESPSLMLAILLGGLALLSRYSEHLVGPLAKLLEWFDKNGIPGIEKVLRKTATWAWDKVLDVLDKMEKFFDKFKKDGEYRIKIEAFILTMQQIFDEIEKMFVWIEKKYQNFRKWVKKYDKDDSDTGFLGLDPNEWEVLVDDMQKIIWKAIKDFAIGAVKAVAVSMLGFTFFGMAMKNLLKAPALLTAVGATGAITKVSKGSRLSRLKGMRGLSMAAVILTGALELIDAVKTGYADAVTDQVGETQSFKWSEFFGGMLGGDKKGGWFNAFAQAFQNVAITGGLVYALMLAGVPLGPFGVGLGLVAGLTIMGLIGFISGLVGADRMSAFFADIGEGIWSVLTTIGDFFKSVWRGLKSLATGGSFLDVYNMTELDVDIGKLAKMEKEVGLPKNISQEAAIAALGAAPSAETHKSVKGSEVHSQAYRAYQMKVKNINELFALRGEVNTSIQGLPAKIKENIALATSALEGLKAIGDVPKGVEGAQHKAKIRGIEKDLEKMRTDLIIAENHAAGLFDDPTAPGNIMTIDRNRMLESLFPPTVKAFDGQSIKQKWANLDQSGLSEMQKSLLNAGKAPAVVDASQTFNSVGGDNVYTGMLSPYHGNGTAQRLSMTRGLQVSIEIPIN